MYMCVCVCENIQVLKKTRSLEDGFIYSLNYFPTLNVVFFKH